MSNKNAFEIKSRYQLYANKETRQRMMRIKDHLENNYDGVADFFAQKIKEEEEHMATLEEKIENQEQQLQVTKERLDELKRLKKKKENREKIQEKKKILKRKQNRYQNIKSTDFPEPEDKRKEIKEEVIDEWKEKCNKKPNITLEDLKNKGRIERDVKARFKKWKDKNIPDEDVDNLRDEILDLQSDIRELSDGKVDSSLFIEVENLQ